eukprot:CAMPEP_0180169108 /NCGR_PEP_ID=MMETSP0986-20121125/33073_1 /TAXON_ID=697907 /ORGANISM="non described non described, Strain CCMP2293" /LENGTH=51 /DNA_ID=CAMNT_0022120621 /DNA_START=41 /DNA_END=193 /DNA_ORIENTATION=+
MASCEMNIGGRGFGMFSPLASFASSIFNRISNRVLSFKSSVRNISSSATLY